VKKKHLKRTIRQLQEAANETEQVLSEQLTEARWEREYVHDKLAELGLVKVEGNRTREDRLRAARAGVLVLADVDLLMSTTWRVERKPLFGTPALGPLEHTGTLVFTGDPEILDQLRRHVIPGADLEPED
jgi:hypothetical protein